MELNNTASFGNSREQYFRLGKHCREHWLKYLDSSNQLHPHDANLIVLLKWTVKFKKFPKIWQKMVDNCQQAKNTS
jgi:hypothetical protein